MPVDRNHSSWLALHLIFDRIATFDLIAPNSMPALTIDERISVGDFQKEFNSIFPFLKIELYKPSREQHEEVGTKAMSILSPGDKMGSSAKRIEISSLTTVAQLKKMLSEKLGINSLIYRKSGSMWIETSLTEDWTLERQNHEAEQMNSNSV